MIRTALTSDPLHPEEVLSGFASPHHGAVVLFLGVVRDHNEGREVTGLEYEAFEAMAEEVLRAIAVEARERYGADRIVILHRIGRLAVGEVSTLTAVSTPHRGEAYEASRYIIEEIKGRLPVWKKEAYRSEEARWLEGHTPGLKKATPEGEEEG